MLYTVPFEAEVHRVLVGCMPTIGSIFLCGNARCILYRYVAKVEPFTTVMDTRASLHQYPIEWRLYSSIRDWSVDDQRICSWQKTNRERASRMSVQVGPQVSSSRQRWIHGSRITAYMEQRSEFETWSQSDRGRYVDSREEIVVRCNYNTSEELGEVGGIRNSDM